MSSCRRKSSRNPIFATINEQQSEVSLDMWCSEKPVNNNFAACRTLTRALSVAVNISKVVRISLCFTVLESLDTQKQATGDNREQNKTIPRECITTAIGLIVHLFRWVVISLCVRNLNLGWGSITLPKIHLKETYVPWDSAKAEAVLKSIGTAEMLS